MDTALANALQRPQLRGFFWLTFPIPEGAGGTPAARTVRLIEGDGTVVMDGQTYRGKDARIGTIAGYTPIENGVASEEQGQDVAFQGWTVDGLNDLRRARGQTMTSGIGVVNEATGLAVGVETLFTGTLEMFNANAAAGEQSVQVSFASIWAKLLRSNEGYRLNSAYHEQAWPGELGLEWTQGLRNLQTQPGVFFGSVEIGSRGIFAALAEQNQRVEVPR